MIVPFDNEDPFDPNFDIQHVLETIDGKCSANTKLFIYHHDNYGEADCKNNYGEADCKKQSSDPNIQQLQNWHHQH